MTEGAAVPDRLPARLAVLIDADNTSASQSAAILEELARYGIPTVKRSYGDWTTQQLTGWKPIDRSASISSDTCMVASSEANPAPERPATTIAGRLGCAFARRRYIPSRRFLWSSGAVVVVKLRVRAGESIQDAVRRFRKLCERSGLRKEMRRKAYYEKPSERRRREELKRLRKALQAARV